MRSTNVRMLGTERRNNVESGSNGRNARIKTSKNGKPRLIHVPIVRSILGKNESKGVTSNNIMFGGVEKDQKLGLEFETSVSRLKEMKSRGRIRNESQSIMIFVLTL